MQAKGLVFHYLFNACFRLLQSFAVYERMEIYIYTFSWKTEHDDLTC